jgi:deoxyribonuclease-2
MEISALDENGKSVDWWFAYKVPHIGGAGPGAAVGYEYVYYDPNIGRVVTSPHSMTMDKGALRGTLDSVFNSTSETTGWVLYNDERPDGSKSTPDQNDNGSLGHSKGMLAFDTASKTALWLLHSWPKFVMPGAKAMPVPDYGQTYLCVSLDLDTASTIAAIMIDHQEPQVFASRLPKSLGQADPLRKLTQAIDPNAKSDSHVLDFKSRGGKLFKMIAKNRAWGGDFWNQLVGPALGVCIDVESWIRGTVPDHKDSNAPGALNLLGSRKTFDVNTIDLTPLGTPWKWPESKDHAKWGISVEPEWVCVGDINRMISQQKRGGGAIAFQEPALWAALRKTFPAKVDNGYSSFQKPPPLPVTTTLSSTFHADPVSPKKSPGKK